MQKVVGSNPISRLSRSPLCERASAYLGFSAEERPGRLFGLGPRSVPDRPALTRSHRPHQGCSRGARRRVRRSSVSRKRTCRRYGWVGDLPEGPAPPRGWGPRGAKAGMAHRRWRGSRVGRGSSGWSSGRSGRSRGRPELRHEDEGQTGRLARAPDPKWGHSATQKVANSEKNVAFARGL
jgi:hypothetical protein